MALIADLPFKYRAMMALYPWRRVQPVPCSPLNKPLAEARIAVVTTGGLVTADQVPFDNSVKGGDYSYRVIPGDVQVATLRETHRSDAFDHSGVAADRNLALPLDPVRALVARGEIGSLAPRHLSFMGSVTAPGRLIKQSAPEAAALLVADEVDLVLLVPV